MVREDGRFFHIDFGYIMGHEPKPFAPPVKLNKEMVEVMGGVDSDAYVEFQTYCCEAYNILRKSAPLLLNLVSLMAESNIPDIAASPEKVLLKLESKFRLDLDDESAGEHLKALMTESVNAIFPKVIETAHRVAQYWR
jgi:phosphatidylinositol 3-kinase